MSSDYSVFRQSVNELTIVSDHGTGSRGSLGQLPVERQQYNASLEILTVVGDLTSMDTERPTVILFPVLVCRMTIMSFKQNDDELSIVSASWNWLT